MHLNCRDRTWRARRRWIVVAAASVAALLAGPRLHGYAVPPDADKFPDLEAAVSDLKRDIKAFETSAIPWLMKLKADASQLSSGEETLIHRLAWVQAESAIPEMWRLRHRRRATPKRSRFDNRLSSSPIIGGRGDFPVRVRLGWIGQSAADYLIGELAAGRLELTDSDAEAFAEVLYGALGRHALGHLLAESSLAPETTRARFDQVVAAYERQRLPK